MARLNGASGQIRFYDSTATPWYLAIGWTQGGLTGPLPPFNRRPQSKILLSRMDASVATPEMIQASDEELFAGTEARISGLLPAPADVDNIVNFLSGQDVNSNSLADTRADATITLQDGSTTVNLPADPDAVKFYVDVEILYSGQSKGIRYPACYFDLSKATFNDKVKGEPISMDLPFTIFGEPSIITAFTSGADVLA